MDRVNGFVQVWHTSSCSKDDSTGVMEAHVTTSSDLAFSFDFPIPRESYASMPLAARNATIRKRDNVQVFDTSFQPVHHYNDFSSSPVTSEVSRAITSASWTTTKIAEACEEFSMVSTFHGMRFVCAKNYHHLRRAFWLLLVLTCLAVLGLQVYKQVIYFNSNPKTVSVEKKLADYVEFPALTICNENTFKITAAVETGLYDTVTSMMAGKLTSGNLKENGKENVTLDDINYALGNTIEAMLLRCKWGEETCGKDNFTTLITDRGLCFTFNGPQAVRDMRVLTPGNAKGLQLTLNVEEYERMAGPNVASGIHILVHMKRDYPMVEQFGQAVAAGSHTFVALTLKKDIRLGPPHDACETGQLTYVPNVTYDYDLPACQTDCFVKFVVTRCGCKDYYMPGNITVCTLKQYVDCLKPAQNDYAITAERYCKCTTPCRSESVETEYSYAALSRSAIDKIKSQDIETIQQKYMKALDVYDYKNENNKFKDNYNAFSKKLHTVTVLYSNVTDMLIDVKTYILKVQTITFHLYTLKKTFLYDQVYVVNKGFVDAKNEMEETTLGEVADDIYVFSYGIRQGIKSISTTSDNNLREVQYMQLKEKLHGRIWLAGLAIENLTQLILAYENGDPIISVDLPDNGNDSVTFDSNQVIPRELLKKAWTRFKDSTQEKNSVLACVSIEAAVYHLNSLLNITNDVYDAGNITAEQEDIVQNNTDSFKQSCMEYLKHRDTFYNEVIKWPMDQLETAQTTLEKAKEKCGTFFQDVLYKIDNLIDLTTGSVLSTFKLADNVGEAYFGQWNVTKFDVADVFLNNVSTHARTPLETSRQTIETNVKVVDGLWSNLDTCMSEIILDILQVEPLKKVVESKQELQIFGDVEMLRLRKNITEQIRLNFSSIESLIIALQELQRLTDVVISDLKIFNDSSVIDSSFYSKNFIFLDVFFTDISYTVNQHHIAYDVYTLLSDIGGSMGLLVGASAISLCEFLDLFCVIATHICRGSRRIGERFRNNSSVTSVYSQR